MKMLACAFIGHRPMRYSFGYDEEDETCDLLKSALADQITMLVDVGITTFYTGMDIGVSQWAAMIVLCLKEKHHNIRLIAVLPCETQANKWSPDQRNRYFNILIECDDVITLNGHYTPTCMLERNCYLVNHAEYLLAVYDNGVRGSIAHTVRYAEGKN
ncbi:MAG: DUF1273 domain-containing protein, partial [Oscillospiraceae bacterium]|nr:DUF1273 domain-containing protein [Oscillospiraceae bacterium]